jgi:hypothetical protein
MWIRCLARPLGTLALLATLAWSAPAALQAIDLGGSLRDATRSYAEMVRVGLMYSTKTQISRELQGRERYRLRLDANIRQMGAQLDRFPPGQNSPPKMALQEAIRRGRHELTVLDGYLNELRAEIRAIDESAFLEAEAVGGTARATARRDLLATYRDLERRCQSAFATLQGDLDAAAREAEVDRDEAIRRAQAKYKLSPDFVKAFRRYCAAQRSSFR